MTPRLSVILFTKPTKQSRAEIEHYYSITYFNYIAVFEAAYY